MEKKIESNEPNCEENPPKKGNKKEKEKERKLRSKKKMKENNTFTKG